ncbi:hypothetical protein [Thioalkalivibrio sp. HK1]|nr:hypothetical protein [Thioalkalivibrio sp. HK1]
MTGLESALTRQATGLAGKVPDLALGIRPTPAPSLEDEDDQDLEGSR